MGRILQWVVALSFALATAPGADAVMIFSETFDGYSSFPHRIPPGDPVNAGPPAAIRGGLGTVVRRAGFESPDSACSGGIIDCDLAVQQYGDGPFGNNPTPVGRFEDDYGKIDNVLLTATTVIPEPSTFACLALGLAGLGWRRTRQVVRRTSNG